jgi:hypothetical protein
MVVPTDVYAIQGSSTVCGGWKVYTVWEGGRQGRQVRERTSVSWASGCYFPGRYPHIFSRESWLPTLATITGVLPTATFGRCRLEALQGKNLEASSLEEVFVGYLLKNEWYGPAIQYHNWEADTGSYW